MPDNGKPTPSDTPMSVLSPGTIFAERYTIEGILGQGGMGVVYRAKDSASGETIALKLIHPNKISGEKALQRLIEDVPSTVAACDDAEAEGHFLQCRCPHRL